MRTIIEDGHGNLLAADADALVNTVNTVGIMGKGIALQFKRAFPANYRAYRNACARGEVQTGRMFLFDTGLVGPRRYIINFPTKQHWRTPSRMQDIQAGLDDLVDVVAQHGISSIAIPALGCGNGGPAWSDVRPVIEQACADGGRASRHLRAQGRTRTGDHAQRDPTAHTDEPASASVGCHQPVPRPGPPSGGTHRRQRVGDPKAGLLPPAARHAVTSELQQRPVTAHMRPRSAMSWTGLGVTTSSGSATDRPR